MSIEWDIEELAGYICSGTEDGAETIVNDGDIDDHLHEKYEVDFETYSNIVKDLLPLTPLVQAGITKKRYHAFIITSDGHGRMIVEQESDK